MAKVRAIEDLSSLSKFLEDTMTDEWLDDEWDARAGDGSNKKLRMHKTNPDASRTFHDARETFYVNQVVSCKTGKSLEVI